MLFADYKKRSVYFLIIIFGIEKGCMMRMTIYGIKNLSSDVHKLNNNKNVVSVTYKGSNVDLELDCTEKLVSSVLTQILGFNLKQ